MKGKKACDNRGKEATKRAVKTGFLRGEGI